MERSLTTEPNPVPGVLNRKKELLHFRYGLFMHLQQWSMFIVIASEDSPVALHSPSALATNATADSPALSPSYCHSFAAII